MMAATLKDAAARKPVLATIRLIVPAGAARPAPPVGPVLGFHRLNLMAFCKDFNARTQKYKAMQVTLTDYKDSTFEFVVKSLSIMVPQEGCRNRNSQHSPRPQQCVFPHSPPRVRDREIEAG